LRERGTGALEGELGLGLDGFEDDGLVTEERSNSVRAQSLDDTTHYNKLQHKQQPRQNAFYRGARGSA